MWKIHRYYLKEVTISTVLTFTVLFGIVMVFMISRGIDRSQGGDLLSAALITIYFTVDVFHHLLAMALLFACVLTFARASQDREITALRAGGISPRVPMVSALLVGIGFSLLGAFALHYVVPWVHFGKYRVIADVTRSFIANTGMSGDKITYGDFTMFWQSKDASGHFHDVLVKPGSGGGLGLGGGKAEDGGVIGRLLHASEAWIEHEPNSEKLDIQFRDLRDARGSYQQALNISLDIREIGEKGLRTDSDKDVTSDHLIAEVMRGVHHNPKGARYTFFKRVCYALIPCLFAPIGFCIGMMSRDRGRTTALLISMVPLIVFYGCDVVAPQLARQLDTPFAAYLPAFTLTLLGVPFCWRYLRF